MCHLPTFTIRTSHGPEFRPTWKQVNHVPCMQWDERNSTRLRTLLAGSCSQSSFIPFQDILTKTLSLRSQLGHSRLLEAILILNVMQIFKDNAEGRLVKTRSWLHLLHSSQIDLTRKLIAFGYKALHTITIELRMRIQVKSLYKLLVLTNLKENLEPWPQHFVLVFVFGAILLKSRAHTYLRWRDLKEIKRSFALKHITRQEMRDITSNSYKRLALAPKQI